MRQPEASGSQSKKQALREDSPDPLSRSRVTHAGAPEDSPVSNSLDITPL